MDIKAPIKLCHAHLWPFSDPLQPLGRATLTRYENERGGMHADTRDKVKRALEAAGVEFIAENGGCAGVRLRK